MMPQKLLLWIALAALLLASPAQHPIAWKLSSASLERVALPFPASRLQAQSRADLDGDGQPEILTISAGQAAITSAGNLRWQSSKTWQVRQALIADLNQDGQSEAVLLVWRPFKPWPVDAWLPNGGRINRFQNATGYSCHLILIGWLRGAFRERWAGSALAEPILAFAAADLTGSGKQLLVTLDGNYDSPPDSPSGQLKVWEWNGFGFSVVSGVTGRFDELLLLRSDTSEVLILTP